MMTTDSDKKFEDGFDGVSLSSARMCCNLHGEVFRARYPIGVPIFVVKAFQIVAGLEPFQKRVAELTGKPIGELMPKDMEKALDEKPLCCWLKPEQLVECYRESNVGISGQCRACGARRFGTPYRTTSQEFKHLCFQCVSTASSTPQNVT